MQATSASESRITNSFLRGQLLLFEQEPQVELDSRTVDFLQ